MSDHGIGLQTGIEASGQRHQLVVYLLAVAMPLLRREKPPVPPKRGWRKPDDD